MKNVNLLEFKIDNTKTITSIAYVSNHVYIDTLQNIVDIGEQLLSLNKQRLNMNRMGKSSFTTQILESYSLLLRRVDHLKNL